MKKKNYLLYGMGKTNSSIKEFFLKNNIQFKEYCDNDILPYSLDEIDIIIKSPGIKPNTKLLQEANKKNILVYNDLELFSKFYPLSKLVIVTGTNGKTSTSRMLSIVLSKKYKCYLGGNIGLPLFSLVSKKKFKDEIVIVEASSYMLDNCYSINPLVYIITNITKHHLDYHQTFENYFTAKTKMINNIKENGLLIIPDNLFLSNIESYNFNIQKFNQKGTKNLKIEYQKIYYNDQVIFGFNNQLIYPVHQLMNMLVVIETALYLGINIERIRKGLEDVTCEKYRMEIIYNDNNTLIINDAKSTNFSSSLAAIQSLEEQESDIYWILGGHGPVDDESITSTFNKVSRYYLYGENTDLIKITLEDNKLAYYQYQTLDEILQSINDDQNKKIVLFSPAAQSFDHYNNFEERGEHFNNLVNKYWHN